MRRSWQSITSASSSVGRWLPLTSSTSSTSRSAAVSKRVLPRERRRLMFSSPSARHDPTTTSSYPIRYRSSISLPLRNSTISTTTTPRIQSTCMLDRHFSSAVTSSSSSNSSNSGSPRDEGYSLEYSSTSSTYTTLSPHQALSLLLETPHGELSLADQRFLLQVITTSGNVRLLERATRELDWFVMDGADEDCLQLLVTGWARIKITTTGESTSTSTSTSAQTKMSTATDRKRSPHQRPSQDSVTGAVVAAQLLREWGRRSVSVVEELPESSSTEASSSSISAPSLLLVLSPPPLSAYRAVLTALSEEGKYTLAGSVLQDLLDASSSSSSNKSKAVTITAKPDRDCFHRVLQACCHAGAVPEALEWLEQMKQTPAANMHKKKKKKPRTILPNGSTYKIVLQTYVNHQKQQQPKGTPGSSSSSSSGTTTSTGLAAYQLLQEMRRTQQPDTVCYNIALNALAEEGNYELAQDLFLQLLQQQQQQQQEPQNDDDDDDDDEDDSAVVATPTIVDIDSLEGAWSSLLDPIPLRAVLKACHRAGTVKAAERAEALVLQQHHSMGVPPCIDARTFTTVVAIWCKLGYPERAKVVLEELVSLYLESSSSTSSSSNSLDPRFQPDLVSFRTVVGAFSQKIGRLVAPSSKNNRNNNRNNNQKHTAELAVELAEQAQQVLMDMHTTMGYTPNLVTCNTILKSWSQARQPEAAEDFLQQQMINGWNINPDIVSYNTVIACHAKLGNVQDCTNWLSKLSSSTTSSPSSSIFPTPNTRTVTSVITALSKQGTPQSAEHAKAWFTQMQEWHADYGWDCAPNQVTLNALLACFSRGTTNGGPRAESLLRQYQHYYHQHHDPSNSAGMSDHDGESTMGPANIISYNTVLQAYSNNGSHKTANTTATINLKKVEALLEELIAVGLQPNDRTMQTVQRALERHTTSDDMDKKQIWEEWRQRFFYSLKHNKNKSGGGSGEKTRGRQDNNNSNNKQSSKQRNRQ